MMSKGPVTFDTTITVRMTKSQREMINALASYQGTKMCDWIRQVAVKEALRQKQQMELDSLSC